MSSVDGQANLNFVALTRGRGVRCVRAAVGDHPRIFCVNSGCVIQFSGCVIQIWLRHQILSLRPGYVIQIWLRPGCVIQIWLRPGCVIRIWLRPGCVIQIWRCHPILAVSSNSGCVRRRDRDANVSDVTRPPTTDPTRHTSPKSVLKTSSQNQFPILIRKNHQVGFWDQNTPSSFRHHFGVRYN